MTTPYYVPQRSSSCITLYLSPKQQIPPVPPELKSTITPETWGTRLGQINQVAGRYSNVILERVWLIFTILAVLIVPVALHTTLVKALGGDPFGGPFQPAAPFIQARGIEFGIGIGILIFLSLPVIIWKAIGRAQVKGMIQRWSRADSVMGGANTFIPVWRVKTPGVWNSSTVLILSLPPNTPPSNFHPDAYLPSYINRPADVDANYYYPYKPEPGMPRMSVIGNVPLYKDEKSNFVDVKV